MKLAPHKSNYHRMLGTIEAGDGGFLCDRMVELINYCVATDGARDKTEIGIWDAGEGGFSWG